MLSTLKRRKRAGKKGHALVQTYAKCSVSQPSEITINVMHAVLREDGVDDFHRIQHCHLISQSRKRDRSAEIDYDDCLPISKRIRKLQIESEKANRNAQDNTHAQGSVETRAGTSQLHSSQYVPTEWPMDPQNKNNHLHYVHLNNNVVCSNQSLPGNSASSFQPGHSDSVYSNVNGSVSIHDSESSSSSSVLPEVDARMDNIDELYEPELNALSNPHYFHINSVLFNAHIARTSRSQTFINSRPDS